MLNSMYDIILVDNVYLAIEEARAMGTYWQGGSTVTVFDNLGLFHAPNNMFSKLVRYPL
jgi:hypothetical protein